MKPDPGTASTAPTGTPIWVPLLVAFIALVGVLVGQWLANRRATDERHDAAAREERQREFLSEANRAAAAREEAHKRFEQRQEAYAALALAVRRWDDVLGDMRAGRVAVDRMPDEEEDQAFEASRVATEEAAAIVDLLASKAVRGAYRAFWIHTVHAEIAIRDEDKSHTEVEKEVNRAGSARDRLMDFLRLDLGVDPEDVGSREAYSKRNE